MNVSDMPSPPPQVHVVVGVPETDHSTEIELTATSYTNTFPEDLPTRPETRWGPEKWNRRLRPRFWRFSPSSFNPIHTPDGQARIRRVVMIAILSSRAASSALSILSAIAERNATAIAIYSLLAILGFWFTATCLAIIGDAAGDRMVTGVIVKRWHFDVFLGFCLLVSILLIGLFFIGLGGSGSEITGFGMWLLILSVAWIAGWEPKFDVPGRSWVA